jgi:SpoU rRNA methylase family enzyme
MDGAECLIIICECRHMIKKKSKESFIAFKEVLKLKYLSILYGLLLELTKSELVIEKYFVSTAETAGRYGRISAM